MIRQLLPEARPLPERADLEEAYLHPDSHHVRVNFISSLDGAIEVEGRSGPLGGPADRAAFIAMRAVCDAVMVGAGTARTENYGPIRLDDDSRRRRLARGQQERPPLVVVTASGDVDPSARLFEEDRHVLLATTEAVAGARPDLAKVAELVPCGAQHVDLATTLRELRARGLGRVLCEGGPSLTRALLVAGLVDELCLTLAPVLAGSGRAGIAGAGPSPHQERLHLVALLEGDGMLIARYGL